MGLDDLGAREDGVEQLHRAELARAKGGERVGGADERVLVVGHVAVGSSSFARRTGARSRCLPSATD